MNKLRDKIKALIARDKRDAKVRRYLKSGMTLSQVAARVGLSRERVRQIRDGTR